jgi:hypothetical protein
VIFIIWSAYRKMVSRSGKTKTTRAGALGRVRDAPERTRIVCRRLARCDPYDSAGDVTTGTIGRRSLNCFTNRLRTTTSIRLAVMKPTTRRGNPAAPRWLPTGPLGYCRIRRIPLRRGTTQLRCRPLFLQTEAPAPSPSVRGLFLPRKTPPARVFATGSFQWAAPAGANGIGAEHLVALCHAGIQLRVCSAIGASRIINFTEGCRSTTVWAAPSERNRENTGSSSERPSGQAPGWPFRFELYSQSARFRERD